MQCDGNVCYIATAVARYHQLNGSWPPLVVRDTQGKPMHSWRALAVASVDSAFAAKYSWAEPWDGPNNKLLHTQMPPYLSCPDSSYEDKKRGITSYYGVHDVSRKESELILPNDSTYYSQIMFVESSRVKANWLQPIDLESVQVLEALYEHPGGMVVCFGDSTAKRSGSVALPLSIAARERGRKKVVVEAGNRGREKHCHGRVCVFDDVAHDERNVRDGSGTKSDSRLVEASQGDWRNWRLSN